MVGGSDGGEWLGGGTWLGGILSVLSLIPATQYDFIFSFTLDVCRVVGGRKPMPTVVDLLLDWEAVAAASLNSVVNGVRERRRWFQFGSTFSSPYTVANWISMSQSHIRLGGVCPVGRENVSDSQVTAYISKMGNHKSVPHSEDKIYEANDKSVGALRHSL
ncbi:FAD-binding Berberine family protein [Striga asiatica]|uniref:FAD-binding Berberine family protein n=1 Tax=Striga asiatica TaxID=4170 RepID=A0A5A7Q3N1_STRAF|nr:FAD-binding Berberine family protein [Striga asiatica]